MGGVEMMAVKRAELTLEERLAMGEQSYERVRKSVLSNPESHDAYQEEMRLLQRSSTVRRRGPSRWVKTFYGFRSVVRGMFVSSKRKDKPRKPTV